MLQLYYMCVWTIKYTIVIEEIEKKNIPFIIYFNENIL
jgi:hypothetical protein